MKKLLILIALVFCAAISFAQFVPNPQGTVQQQTQFRGAVTGLRGIMITPNDTLNSPATPYFGALTVLPSDAGKDTITIWVSNGLHWVRFSGGTAFSINDTIYTRAPIAVDKITLPGKQIIYLLHADGLVSGGIITQEGCLTIGVTAPIYFKNYRQYTAAAVFGLTALPIAAPDPTLDRIDLVVADTNLLISVITGTPALLPQPPQYNTFSQVVLGQVPVAGGLTCLGFVTEVIYDQNTEWTITTTGTISQNPDNTDQPYHLTKADYIVTYTNGSQIIFTKPSGVDTVQAGEIIKMFPYLFGPFSNLISGQWYNGATAVSNSILLNPYFNSTDTNHYQQLVAPLSAWNFSNTAGYPQFNKLVLTFGGEDISGAKGLYLDYIQLQTGIINIATSLQLTTIGSSGAATLIDNVLNIPVYTGGTGTVTSIATTSPITGGTITTTGTIGLGTVPIANGGTNITTYTTGDLLYASASNTLSKLAIGTVNQTLHIVGGVPVWRDTTSALGSQNLQQVTAIGNTTTYPMYSTDSIKAFDFYSTGGSMFADSSALSPADSIVLYGASVELGNASGGAGYPGIVATNLGTTINNKAITGTSFQMVSAGDSSFINRLYTIPTYRTTERYIVIGGGNILNDMNFHIGSTTLGAAIARAVDTIRINRGWPLSRIIVEIPSQIGHYLYPPVTGPTMSNDSLILYVNAAIAAAKTKGVQYVDAYTYTLNNGAATLMNADSIHPNALGHYEISEAFTYRISDVKVNNSLRVQRDFLTKGSASIGNKLTMVNTPAGSTGNFVGQLNWGSVSGLGVNNILLYDLNTTALRAGIGLNSSAELSFLGRGNTRMLFSAGQDATTVTNANAQFYINSSTVSTPVTLGTNSNCFNGENFFYNLGMQNKLTFAPIATNVATKMSWGNSGAVQGLYTLNAGSTSLRAGLMYDGAVSGNSYLFGRGGFPFYAGIGLDESNLSASNSSWYINDVNRFFANGISEAIVAKTSTYIATTADATINYTSGTATITLPSSIGISGTEYTIKNSGTGVITIQGNLNGIATFGAITGGSGYTNGSYTGVVLLGGTGAGATANITVAGGAVTVVTIVAVGKAYTVADAITATASIGPGTGFTVPVATVYTQTIDGATTKTLNTQYSGFRLQSDNANWIIIGAF